MSKLHIYHYWSHIWHFSVQFEMLLTLYWFGTITNVLVSSECVCRLYLRNVTHILHLFGPDIAVFCVFFVSRMIFKNHLPNRHLSWETLQLQAVRTIYLMRRKTFTTTNEVGIFIMTLVMSVCSVIHPSGLNAVYLLVFFGVMTSWSFLVTLQKRKHVMRISTFLSFYTAVHLILLYLYQFQSAQDLVPRHTPFARYVLIAVFLLKWTFLHLVVAVN